MLLEIRTLLIKFVKTKLICRKRNCFCIGLFIPFYLQLFYCVFMQMIVDRSTIARHLLSDQTDPFNRQPLTMEQVIKNDPLQEKIQNWIREQKIKRSSSS